MVQISLFWRLILLLKICRLESIKSILDLKEVIVCRLLGSSCKDEEIVDGIDSNILVVANMLAKRLKDNWIYSSLVMPSA